MGSGAEHVESEMAHLEKVSIALEQELFQNNRVLTVLVLSISRVVTDRSSHIIYHKQYLSQVEERRMELLVSGRPLQPTLILARVPDTSLE